MMSVVIRIMTLIVVIYFHYEQPTSPLQQPVLLWITLWEQGQSSSMNSLIVIHGLFVQIGRDGAG